ncbi:MAG: hypothetical protein L0922_03240 [Candidatus Mariimomonas ferrooxydans]
MEGFNLHNSLTTFRRSISTSMALHWLTGTGISERGSGNECLILISPPFVPVKLLELSVSQVAGSEVTGEKR